MPLYYFHVRAGGRLDADEIGLDLPNLDVARVEALKGMVDLMRDAAIAGTSLPGQAFEIMDESGQHQLTVPFDALDEGGERFGV